MCAMAVTMERLSRTPLTGLGCSGRRKVWLLLWDLIRAVRREMKLKLQAAMGRNGSAAWWMAWRHWAPGWTYVVAQRLAPGTESPRQINSLFTAKKRLLCDPKIPVKRRIHAFLSTCVAAALHGAGERATHSPCFRHNEFGNLASSDVSYAYAEGQPRLGWIT